MGPAGRSERLTERGRAARGGQRAKGASQGLGSSSVLDSGDLLFLGGPLASALRTEPGGGSSRRQGGQGGVPTAEWCGGLRFCTRHEGHAEKIIWAWCEGKEGARAGA